MIATAKLYQSIDFHTYNQAKNDFIASLDTTYETKSTSEKWDFIFSRFAVIIPESERAIWATFQNNCKKDAHLPAFDLDKYLSYFENYYFVCQTEDENFKLNEVKKAQLLEEIKRFISKLERPSFFLMEQLCQKHKASRDWLVTFLFQERSAIFLEIYRTYMQQYEHSELRESVSHWMLHVADSYGLNLKSGYGVKYSSDFFSFKNQREAVDQYYQAHFPQAFRKYEASIIDKLSQHLLEEIKEKYLSGNGEERIISKLQEESFANFINTERFCLVTDVKEEMRCDDENRQVFKLKSDDELLAIFRLRIAEKLLHEEYFISPEQIQELGDDNKLTLTQGITYADLVGLINVCAQCNSQTIEQTKENLIPYYHVILHVPALFFSYVRIRPELIMLLPKAVTTNTCFLKQALHFFATQLSEAAESNVDEVEEVREGIFAKIHYLIGMNKLHYYNLLPPNLRNGNQNTGFAVSLRLLQLSDSKDPEYFTLSEQDRTFLAQQLVEFEAILRTDCKLIPNLDKELKEKQTAIAKFILASAHSLNLSQMVKFTQFITPEMLIEVVETRQAHNLPSLPCCADLGMLTNFLKALQSYVTCFESDGWLSVKESADELACFNVSYLNKYENSLFFALAKNDSWFMAMLHYEQIRLNKVENLQQLWLRLREIIVETVKWSFLVAGSVLVALSFLLLAQSMLTLFFSYSGFAIINLLLGIFILLWGAVFQNNKMYAVGVSVLLTVLVPHLLFVLPFCAFATFSIVTLLPFAENLLRLNFRLLSDLFTSFKNINFLYNISSDADLSTKCEASILRLKCIGTPSALQKAEVLDTLWANIKEYSNANLLANSDLSVEKRWESCLNTPFCFFYRGKEHWVSFRQIAAITRSDSKPFEITTTAAEITSSWRFFKPTTSKFLPEMKSIAVTEDVERNSVELC